MLPIPSDDNCPCESGLTFLSCCAPCLSGKITPKTPVALMRSRYTAYTLGKISYIQSTMSLDALRNFQVKTAKSWATSIDWKGLEILEATEEKKGIAYVEFCAYYILDDQFKMLHERSRFKRILKGWSYVGAARVKKQPIQPRDAIK